MDFIQDTNGSESGRQRVDFFSGLFENRKSKIVSLLFSSLGSCVVVLLIYCVIWYNKFGSDSKRTLLNRLYWSTWCWALLWICTVQQVDILRFIIGPMPQVVCQAKYFVKRCITLGGVLTMGFIMVSRYTFIFWLKNPAAFEDEFWSLFINCWTIVFTLISEIFLLWIPGKDNIDVYICAGTDPGENEGLPEKNIRFSVAVKALSFAIQFVLMARIQIYKLKIWRENRTKFLNFNWLSSVETHSAAENLVTGSPLVLMVSAFLLQYSRPKTNFSNLNDYPGCLKEYMYTLIRPVLVCLLLALYQYIREKKCFVYTLIEFKSMFSDYFSQKLKFQHKTQASSSNGHIV